MNTRIDRVIALGASNLTLGLPAVLSTVRASWGPGVEVFAALGLGRSYGAPSRVLARTLPGILQSGLWHNLESLPPAPTRGLITDIGNDILYGFGSEQILEWVAEAMRRLRHLTRDILVTELPLASIRCLSPKKFLLFRTIFFPSSRMHLGQVLEGAEQVNDGLSQLAAAHEARLVRQKSEWYGLDPVHIRARSSAAAWKNILEAPTETHPETILDPETLRLCLLAPERRWLLGVERFTPQNGFTLPSGLRLWLY